jgi:hypothetical protein
MANYFTILDLPVSLALDVEAIEGSWRERAKSSDDASLHEARATLTDPVNRLEHWLATHEVTPERGSSIDPNMMDLFSCLHGVLADTDRVIEGLRSGHDCSDKSPTIQGCHCRPTRNPGLHEDYSGRKGKPDRPLSRV